MRPPGQNFFILTQFSEVIGQIVCWRSPGVGTFPLGNPGCATGEYSLTIYSYLIPPNPATRRAIVSPCVMAIPITPTPRAAAKFATDKVPMKTNMISCNISAIHGLTYWNILKDEHVKMGFQKAKVNKNAFQSKAYHLRDTWTQKPLQYLENHFYHPRNISGGGDPVSCLCPIIIPLVPCPIWGEYPSDCFQVPSKGVPQFQVGVPQCQVRIPQSQVGVPPVRTDGVSHPHAVRTSWGAPIRTVWGTPSRHDGVTPSGQDGVCSRPGQVMLGQVTLLAIRLLRFPAWRTILFFI